MLPVVLVVAGSDSSGGAGLQRDLQMLAGEAQVRTAVTAVTAQSDSRVYAVHPIPIEILAKQIVAAISLGRIDAIKIGMLGREEVVTSVQHATRNLARVPMVIDPVLATSSGTSLLDEPGRNALLSLLCPRAALLTPNLAEAALLLDEACATSTEEQEAQAVALAARARCPVLVKGGHAGGAKAVDILVHSGTSIALEAERREGSPRGTGCALSSRIALRLAQGVELEGACRLAKSDIACLWGGGFAERA